MPRSTPPMISSVDGPVGRRLQRDVGHPLHRHVAGGVGEGAAVGPRHAAQPGHVPVDLVADEDAVLDDVPLLAGDALVVPADRGQPVLGGAVAGDVHQRRAVLQAAELVDGGERRAGVGRLVAQRPVELGGVPDRLVDGEEQVGGVDDEVVAAGLDRRRLRLLAQQLGDLGELAAPVPVAVPVRYSQPLPTGGARVRMLSNWPVARSTVSAVNSGWMRTRCWRVRVPAVSA